jgi:hypothetical protein
MHTKPVIAKDRSQRHPDKPGAIMSPNQIKRCEFLRIFPTSFQVSHFCVRSHLIPHAMPQAGQGIWIDAQSTSGLCDRPFQNLLDRCIHLADQTLQLVLNILPSPQLAPPLPIPQLARRMSRLTIRRRIQRNLLKPHFQPRILTGQNPTVP